RLSLELYHGDVISSVTSNNLLVEPMTLYVLRAGPENGVDLGQGPGKILTAQERLGQDQSGRGVVRMADETVAAGRHRIGDAPGLAVEIREQREAERCRILLQPLLVAADGGGERQLVGR